MTFTKSQNPLAIPKPKPVYNSPLTSPWPMLEIILIATILILLIPIYQAFQVEDIWQKMLAFASISSKASIIILIVSVLRDDWWIGVIAVIILSVGNAGLMLLANVLKRIYSP
jgi:multicomponent Na+:H+ antiporter subunit F